MFNTSNIRKYQYTFLLHVDNHDILRHTKSRQIHMGEKRQWDESRSPQWRYLLSKDSKEKRAAEKRRERAERELSRSGVVSKRKEKRQAQDEGHQENRKLKSKSGKEILYSASPGGENSSYRNTEFIELLHNRKTTIPSLIDNNES